MPLVKILSLIGQYWSGKVNIGQTIRLAHAIKVSIGQSHKTSPLKTEVGGAKDCHHIVLSAVCVYPVHEKEKKKQP